MSWCRFLCCKRKPTLTYDNLLKKDIYHVKYDGYQVIHAQGFINIFRDDSESSDINVGWKIQFSINDEASNQANSNLARGSDIVIAHLIRANVTHFKLVPPGVRMHEEGATAEIPEGYERGKQITVYAFEDNLTTAQWTSLLQNINDALLRAQIQPAHQPPPSSHMITGSAYISYRNDNNGQGGYNNANTNMHNPGNAVDPFQSIEIQALAGNNYQTTFIPLTSQPNLQDLFNPPAP